ncbi:MAG TPA: hypothetical protein PK385_10540 [Spirochaetota bacterium]|nr:hypothetical protein [Spirochaetota bacterium]HOS33229.1 hypothetical protein [Spirochaetota bacterium]HOS56483.1 hypothetical protein [Spirochaetota bacterium]HQF78739.1 hypothetical protein [Spirochaetota bacterium]HQH30390.1 hypothetical protein [Spirochaetota bacterium]
MSARGALSVIFTVVFLVTSAFFIVFQTLEVKSDQNSTAEQALNILVADIKKGTVKESAVRRLPKNFFYVLWVEDERNVWIPLLYDKKIDVSNLENPLTPPIGKESSARKYLKSIDNVNFIMWINKFNPEFYIKNILLTSLFLAFLYLLILLIIHILFRPPVEAAYSNAETEFEDIEFEEKAAYDVKSTAAQTDKETEAIKESDREKVKTAETVEDANSEILDEYKSLWYKNFKISDDFKNNFPFKKILASSRIDSSPEELLKKALAIASEYFRWENPNFYIKNGDKYIDVRSNSPCELTKIEIANKGDKKGNVYIPLYPFKNDNLYGYLFFEWNRVERFYIADVLFFLKYLFSEDNKIVFIKNGEMDNAAKAIQAALDKKNNNCFCALIAVDNREKIRIEHNPLDIETLDKMIFNKLKSNFKKDTVINISPMKYFVFGEKITSEKSINLFKEWAQNKDAHNYKVSATQNIAVTFSIGIATRGERELRYKTLITEAENNLRRAASQGGDQIV